MTAPDGPLPRLHVPVRPAHYETPGWYLKRLCVANAVEHHYILRLVRQRDRAMSSTNALGVVIAELGGPEPDRWTRSHTQATRGLIRPEPPRDPFRAQRASRMACTSCTAGQPIVTYDHIRFGFCLKHRRWLAGGRAARAQPTVVLDSQLLRTERLARRLVASEQADQDHYDTAADITSHWAHRSGHAATRAHARPEDGADNRLTLYPETIRLMEVISSPQFAVLMTTGRRGADRRRTHLRQQLDWMTVEQWLAVEAVESWATSRQQRLDCTFLDDLTA